MNSYTNQSNFFEGRNPEQIASEYGTPLYVYNERILRDRMEKVAKVITKYPYTANYSVKANSNIHILKLALQEGNNCDAMSVGEIQMLLKAGFPTDRIFFVPNNVSDELVFAVKNGIMTSLDSLAQLELYGQICCDLELPNEKRKCAVRINPGTVKKLSQGERTLSLELQRKIFPISLKLQKLIA